MLASSEYKNYLILFEAEFDCFPFRLSVYLEEAFYSNPAPLHIWMTLMSPEGCRDPTPAPPVSAPTVLLKGGSDPQAHCEKVAGESATGVWHRNTTSPAQHPEVGTGPGTSAPCLISIIADEGLGVGLR